MASVVDVERQLTVLLDAAAKKLHLKNYSLNLNLTALKGDGFLGEFYKVAIIDQEHHRTIELAVKRAPTEATKREQGCIENVYKSEIYFYHTVFPTLDDFQKLRKVSQPFDLIPEYITSIDNIGQEAIVFKDITALGFKLHPKDLLINHEHANFIFNSYGRFHALSFAYRDQKPEEFEGLAQGIPQVMLEFKKSSGFEQMISKMTNLAIDTLDPVLDADVLAKCQRYRTDAFEIFYDCYKYDGDRCGILHGDCWSNNMMFKYQDNSKSENLQSMNLLDFQLIAVGTPVYDLSYFFYAGCCKEMFDKLDDYLDIYHESFSKFAKELGSNPDKLLTREQLTDDWRRYAKYGMLFALIVVRIKLVSKEATIDLVESTYNDIDVSDKFVDIKCDEDLYKKRVRDILIHMYEIDAL